MLEASASSELLCVATESFIHVLAPPRREAIAEFAVEFSAKLCQAGEAKQPHMTDLSVGVDFDAVIASTSVASRSLISQPVLGRQ